MQVSLDCTKPVVITVTEYDKENNALPDPAPVKSVDVTNAVGNFGTPVQLSKGWVLDPGNAGATATVTTTFTAADGTDQTIVDEITLAVGAADHYGAVYTPTDLST